MEKAVPSVTNPSTEATAVDQVVTPWKVEGSVAEDGRELGINYEKLIDQFGTRPIDDALLKRFKAVTGHEPHRLLRRGTFFSHRYAIALSSMHYAHVFISMGVPQGFRFNFGPTRKEETFLSVYWERAQ